MQMLRVYPNTTLADLTDRVGVRNVERVLAANRLPRVPNVGAKHYLQEQDALQLSEVSVQRKITVLNSLVDHSDLFELAALQDNNAWKILDSLGSFAGTIRIPEFMTLAQSDDVLGDNHHVEDLIYSRAMNSIQTTGSVSSDVFARYSSITGSSLQPHIINPPRGSYGSVGGYGTFEAFHLPWGQITLYSSLSGTSVEFPVYPEELDDAKAANFTQMPELLYQYEPWQLYQSSGPRDNRYTFHFHRDMWTGDHRDGKANALIRFCEANCYPDYNGSAVNVSSVTLYVAGSPLITGVMTRTNTHWSGPIGLDGWYLECKLEINIVEVSTQPLNFGTVMSKGLIG